MILPAQTIRALCNADKPLVSPFVQRGVIHGMTYGLSAAGYDMRLDQEVYLKGGGFTLASTMEFFNIPNDLMMEVKDKSSLARRGIAVQNTCAEPGWSGFLTLEITNHSREGLRIAAGSPVAQAIFHRLEAPTEQPYVGRYQNQPRGPQPMIYATVSNTRGKL